MVIYSLCLGHDLHVAWIHIPRGSRWSRASREGKTGRKAFAIHISLKSSVSCWKYDEKCVSCSHSKWEVTHNVKTENRLGKEPPFVATAISLGCCPLMKTNSPWKLHLRLWCKLAAVLSAGSKRIWKKCTIRNGPEEVRLVQVQTGGPGRRAGAILHKDAPKYNVENVIVVAVVSSVSLNSAAKKSGPSRIKKQLC